VERGSITLSGSLVAHKVGADDGTGEAIRIDGPFGRTGSADIGSSGDATYDVGGGRAPQNEEGSPDTARLLVRKLRELGQEWSDPVRVDGGDIDCRATDGACVPNVQVTRAAPPDVWQSLATAGKAHKETDADAAADALMEAVNRKARLPPAQLGGLVLAIDARETPVFATLTNCIGEALRREANLRSVLVAIY
jgi:hypothetical protein